MSEITDQLRASLRRQRRQIRKLFSLGLHPTASSILDQGAKVIISGGGGALTMRAVATRAGIKLASLQYHFKTFDQLVAALFTREFGFIADVLWKTLERLESQSIPPAEGLRTAVEQFMPLEDQPDGSRHQIYYHLLAFCSYNSDAFQKAKAFYRFYNTLIGFLVSRMNPSLPAAECLARATMITSTLEGSCIYTILRAGELTAEKAVHREIGPLAVYYALLPSAAER